MSRILSMSNYSAKRRQKSNGGLPPPTVHAEYEELCPDCRGMDQTDRCQCNGSGAVLSLDGLELLQFLERYGYVQPARDPANPDIGPRKVDTNRCFWCGVGALYDHGRGFMHKDTGKRECGPEYPGRNFAGTAGHQSPGELNR